MQSKNMAYVDKQLCVACGACENACPMGAIRVYKGVYAKVNTGKCVGCRKCEKTCPAGAITVKERMPNEEEILV